MKLAEAPMPAAAPPVEPYSPPALAPRGVSLGLTLSPREGRIVTDAASLKVSSIVRVLSGALAGRIGLVERLWGGQAKIAVVASELKRRRRYDSVRIETGLRRIDTDMPHLDPKVGDEVFVYFQRGGQGHARVCALSGRTATVRTCFDKIEAVDLGPTEPVLDVLYEPVLTLADGSEVSLDVNLKKAFSIPMYVPLADSLGEFLLEVLEARERRS